MGVYAPTRGIETWSLLWMDPEVEGSLVGQDISERCHRTGLEWLLGQCTPEVDLTYAEVLEQFQFVGSMGGTSRLVPFSWREEPVEP